MYSALIPFTQSGKSLFQIQAFPEGVAGNCLKEYDTLHIYLVALIVYSVGQVLLQILTATKPCKGVCVCIVALFENCLNFYLLYVMVQGIELVAFQDKKSDYMKCEYLHNVAWWFFVGLPLIAFPCVCAGFLACGAMIVASSKKADARESGLVVTPDIEEVAYKELPGADV